MVERVGEVLHSRDNSRDGPLRDFRKGEHRRVGLPCVRERVPDLEGVKGRLVVVVEWPVPEVEVEGMSDPVEVAGLVLPALRDALVLDDPRMRLIDPRILAYAALKDFRAL